MREGEIWRKSGCNAKLQELIRERDTVKFIKSQRIQRLGHVQRMEEDRMRKRVMKGELYYRKWRGQQE